MNHLKLPHVSLFLFFYLFILFILFILFNFSGNDSFPFGVWRRHGSALRRMLSHNLFFSARNFTEGWVTAAPVLLIGEIDPQVNMHHAGVQTASCTLQHSTPVLGCSCHLLPSSCYVSRPTVPNKIFHISSPRKGRLLRDGSVSAGRR